MGLVEMTWETAFCHSMRSPLDCHCLAVAGEEKFYSQESFEKISPRPWDGLVEMTGEDCREGSSK